jgi:hypothetical protein
VSPNPKGTSLDKLNLHFVYRLGATLGPLAGLTPESTTGDIIWACLDARSRLAEMFNTLPALHLCRAKAKELDAAVSELMELFDRGQVPEFSVVPGPAKVGEFEYSLISQKAAELQIILAEELQGLPAYHPQQIGIYDTPSLIERAEQILPDSTRAKLEKSVVSEIREAGKCLAFGLSTASAFHMMRATEAVMHQYYVRVCTPSSDATLTSWGAYIAELRKRLRPDKTDDEVTAMLQQVKDDHRNLIMHPEVVLSAEDAFALFDLAKAVISVIAARLA